MKYRAILLRAALPFRLSSESSNPDQGNTAPRRRGRVTDSVSLTTRAAKENQKSRDFVCQIKDDERSVLKMYKVCHLEEHAETH
jgi:hypothetical protein